MLDPSPLGCQFVVVDSNAITYGPWRLDSAAWRVLLYKSRSGAIRLIVPELVVREAIARFSDAVRKWAAEINHAVDKLREATGAAFDTSNAEPELLISQYETDLRTTLLDSKVIVAPLPQVALSILVDKAASRRRPFDENGNGFRDALLWETTVDLIRQNPDTGAVLISNDLKAFADPSQPDSLHPSLQGELAVSGSAGSVLLARSISGYLDSQGAGDTRTTAEIAEAIERHHLALVDRATDRLIGAEFGNSNVLEGTARIVDATDIEIRLHSSTGGGRAGSGVVFAHLSIQAMVQVEWSVANNSPPTLSYIRTTMSAPATAAFDFDSRSFTTLDVELPAWDTIPEVVREIASRLSPRQAVQFPPEVLEQLRRASQFQFPPEVLEQLRRASQFQFPPEVLEQLRRASQFQFPPEVLEQLRRASQFQLPPDHPDDELGQSDGDSDSSTEEDEGYEGTDGDQPPESPE